jgi:hypothetical protein
VARISVGDLRLHLTARKADGGTAPFGLIDAACTPKCGQNGLVASFVVTGGAGTPTAATQSGTPGAGIPPCSTAAGGTSVASRLMPYTVPLALTTVGVVIVAIGGGTALFLRRRRRKAASAPRSSEE